MITDLPPIEPPTNGELQRGSWTPLPAGDPLAAYLAARYAGQLGSRQTWEAARLSHAAAIYRERVSGWAVVAKFYTVKTGDNADRHARHEFEVTQQARAAGLAQGDYRALEPLAVWRGVLILEYVDGLTLEDVIAVRRHRPGELLPALERAARLLATLHAHGAQADAAPDPAQSTGYARKLVEQLARWGVLEGNQIVCDGLDNLIARWAASGTLAEYAPTLLHGDATTTNFVFPWDGGVVGIDWERLKVSDPAADLGRLMAEVSHSVHNHGGDVAEAVPLVDHLVAAYCAARACEAGFTDRLRFHRASSTLRIARNGWVSRLDRTALVAEALALLARCP